MFLALETQMWESRSRRSRTPLAAAVTLGVGCIRRDVGAVGRLSAQSLQPSEGGVFDGEFGDAI